jgi:hypothetical protein
VELEPSRLEQGQRPVRLELVRPVLAGLGPGQAVQLRLEAGLVPMPGRLWVQQGRVLARGRLLVHWLQTRWVPDWVL